MNDKQRKQISNSLKKAYKEGRIKKRKTSKIIKIKCSGCNKIFEVPFWQRNKKYCSQKCFLFSTKPWNNIMKQEYCGKSNSSTLKKLYKEGKIKSWNEGFTKDTNKKLKEIGKNISIALKGRRCYWQEGNKNWNWRGGLSFLKYDEKFNRRFKKQIKDRDNYICQLCDKKIKLLHIHHIDYNKKNTCKENCISLCNNCHGETGKNRENWKLFFQDMLNYKYNYNIGNIMITIIPEELPSYKLIEMLK